jgi:hypothetical protein
MLAVLGSLWRARPSRPCIELRAVDDAEATALRAAAVVLYITRISSAT